MRAWLALKEAQLDFDEEVVDIRRPQRYRNLAAMSRLSPPAMVPVLLVGEHVVFDSNAIMEFANDACGGELLPRDRTSRAKARSVVAWQHAGLSGICARVSFESAFYPFKRRLTVAEQAECARLFDWLENLLGIGGGPYLFGAVSLADFALAPTVVRLSRHRPDLATRPQASRWVDALLQHRFVEEWLASADRLPHVWSDDYLLPGEAVEMYRDDRVQDPGDADHGSPIDVARSPGVVA